MKIYLGIDVSKNELDCYNSATKEYFKVDNNPQAIKAFLTNYSPSTTVLVAEPTGTYSNKICELATNLDYKVLLANPLQSSRYMQVLNPNNKTDRSASKALATLAQQVQLHPYKGNNSTRKQLRMVHNALQKQQRALKIQIASLEQYLAPSNKAINSLKTVQVQVEQELQKIATELFQLNNMEEKEFYQLATSVVGIGPVTAHALLHYANGFEGFENSNQLVKFTGIAPVIHTSGSSVRKRANIGKNGSSMLRAYLYNGAKSAKRFNYACKELYERLKARGKAHKVAMVAVMRKLLRQVFAVVKHKKAFDNNLHLHRQKK